MVSILPKSLQVLIEFILYLLFFSLAIFACMLLHINLKSSLSNPCNVIALSID